MKNVIRRNLAKVKSAVAKAAVPGAVASTGLAISTSASAQGLSKATGVLTALQTELTTIIPICAIILLLISAIGYAGGFLQKDTFVRWAVGIVIGGSAAQIVAMLFT